LLSLGERRLVLASDGLSAFEVETSGGPTSTAAVTP
jgi:hypothetical protein